MIDFRVMENMLIKSIQFIRDNGRIMRDMVMEKNILRVDQSIVEISVEE